MISRALHPISKIQRFNLLIYWHIKNDFCFLRCVLFKKLRNKKNTFFSLTKNIWNLGPLQHTCVSQHRLSSGLRTSRESLCDKRNAPQVCTLYATSSERSGTFIQKSFSQTDFEYWVVQSQCTLWSSALDMQY